VKKNICRRIIIILVIMTLMLEGCTKANDGPDEKTEGVMTYAEYTAAPFDSEVVVETYVQDTETWMDNNVRVYTQDKDGAYFIYQMSCDESEALKLTPGTKIRVTGRKTVWAKQIEIVDAVFNIIDGKYIAEPVDVTDTLSSDELINMQNIKACVKGVRIEDTGYGQAFYYGEDGSGVPGDDIYFIGRVNDEDFTFKVESNLCDVNSDVYKAVSAINVGDIVDMEVFLCWNEKVLPYVTSITVSEK